MFWHEGQMHMPLLAIAPLDELKFLIDDNCATNQPVATKLTVPLVGCASHRFNLATQKYFTRHSEIIDDVAALMAALRAPNNRKELRRHTNLAPLRDNATRWSSTFAVLKRNVKISDAIKHVEAVYVLVQNPAAHRRIKALLENLLTFNSVCKKLQEDDLSMAAVRVLFDRIIEMYPVTKEHLGPDARIVHSPSFESQIFDNEVHSPSFESGVVKVVTNCVEALSEDETTALKPFELQVESTAAPRGGSARRTCQQPREEDFSTTVLRYDAPAAPATPHYCEIVQSLRELFSQCKLILTPQRASLLPINFETLSFLRLNMQYWDASTLMALVIDEKQ
ncbi:hypothetical protein PHMEG_0003655 [Phytophthora megakarya]|uniref:Uncharacterized protein n=1 Tax=Phytophthora megakarya TaxID=4795 RepID=A0A225WXG0_9STRA|nr:hypothetical protein PHMEG_0003655 [Phytophthora megakarya]